MPECLSEFPQCSVIRQLVSMQAVHDVIACHHILDLAPVAFGDELIMILIAFESLWPGSDDGGMFLCAIIMPMEKGDTLQFLVSFSFHVDGLVVNTFLWTSINFVQDCVSGMS